MKSDQRHPMLDSPDTYDRWKDLKSIDFMSVRVLKNSNRGPFVRGSLGNPRERERMSYSSVRQDKKKENYGHRDRKGPRPGSCRSLSAAVR